MKTQFRRLVDQLSDLRSDDSFEGLTRLPPDGVHAAVEGFIRERRGLPAVACLLYLDDGLAHAFNAVMSTATGTWIDKAYVYTLSALVRKIDAGEITGLGHLRKFAACVLGRTRFRFGTIDWAREHPLVAGPEGGSPRRSNTTHSGSALAAAAAPALDPAERLERAERLPKLLAGARRLGYVGCRVVSEYRRYEEAFMTTHGAYPHLARLAVLNEQGDIVGFRRVSAAGGGSPTPALIRRVRRLHRQSRTRLHGIARELGYDAPFTE